MSTALSSDSLSHTASRSRRRVLILVSHVVQYASPLFEVLAADPRLDTQVAYCSLQGSERGLDPEFGVEIQWDRPLLDGYAWTQVPNKSWRPGLGRFFGLWNPGLWKLIRTGNFDAVVIYTGYMCASFWLAVIAAKSKGIAVLISSDSTVLTSRNASKWRTWIKPQVLGSVYRTVDVLMASSAANKKLAMEVGMPEERIVHVRSGMNKEEWQARAAQFDRDKVRRAWNVPSSASVVFYCAKLQDWKRPLDLVRAFARARVPHAYLVMAGEGPQRGEIEREIELLGIGNQVRLLGFVNTSELPGFYKASDLFALPSWYDPCPLVVPEAMLSGIPVVLSDTILGRLDMIDEGNSGFQYRCGDIEQLADILRKTLGDREVLERLKNGVAEQMKAWTAQNFADTWTEAVEVACARRPVSILR